MGNRGRPRTPDVLTPREYEVLALLREGLSNREIAERLGISLAGAKFHVSEIIGKLGVASREEAARWQQRSQRWGFAPLSALGSWREAATACLTPKLALGAMGGLAVIGITAGVLVGTADDGSSRLGNELAAVEPTPTPNPDPCAEEKQPEDCIGFRMEKLYFASLEEAAAVTSFVPQLPEELPEGYHRTTLGYAWPGEIRPDLRESFDSKGPRAPFEGLYAEYESDNGGRLLVNQGYSIGMAGSYADAPTRRRTCAPAHLRGKVTDGARTIYWYQGNYLYEYSYDDQGRKFGKPAEDAWEDNGRVTVYWQVSAPRQGTGWEIAPDGTRREFPLSSRPFEYVLHSETLPVEEMLKVALSVPQ